MYIFCAADAHVLGGQPGEWFKAIIPLNKLT